MMRTQCRSSIGLEESAFVFSNKEGEQRLSQWLYVKCQFLFNPWDSPSSGNKKARLDTAKRIISDNLGDTRNAFLEVEHDLCFFLSFW